MLRFILTALIIGLISRYVFFVYSKMRFNTRYLYPVAFNVIVLCVPGFTLLVRLLKQLTKKINWIKEKHLIIFLLFVIGIACIGKALNPPKIKYYIQDTAKIIKGRKTSISPILISNIRDATRVAWHSDAQLIPLSSVISITYPVNFENTLRVLNTKNRNIFVLVKFKDDEFRKLFSNKKIEFPATLIFLKEFKVKRNTFSSLYKVKFSEKTRKIK